MIRILFVDDEPLVLASLRDALRRERQHWHMVFVESAQDALRELEKGHFDAMVTDMRMPMMDGATLLRCAHDRFPGMARLALSGHAEYGRMRPVPAAHVFLMKPCSPEVLRAAVEQGLQAARNDARARVNG
jgi:DNA-binding NtrC family response regulator